jgi:hypothetical protein
MYWLQNSSTTQTQMRDTAILSETGKSLLDEEEEGFSASVLLIMKDKCDLVWRHLEI